MTKRILGFVCALGVVGATAAFAETATPAPSRAPAQTSALPQNEAQIQERMKTFDPAAVAAAQHYYNSPMIKTGMLSMVTSLTPSIMANIGKEQGKQLSDADREKAVKVLNAAMQQNFDFLISLNMVLALETFSKDQLVALDTFYSSPTGQSILAKMPTLSKSMPTLFQAFLPRYLATVKDDLKKEGIGAP